MTAAISDKPWSEYTAADYTPEQWHRACLIHQHSGAPTGKNQCKLPVRTPTGTLNRNGVHAAAAALAGARGGVQAAPDELVTARKALARLYSQLGEDPPPSLLMHSGMDVLAHYGIRGMHWGVRRSRKQIDNAPEPDDAPEHTRAQTLHTTAKSHGTRKLSNKELQDLTQRLNLEQQYTRLTTSEKGKSSVSKGAGWVGKRMGTLSTSIVDEVLKANAKQYLLGKGVMPSGKK